MSGLDAPVATGATTVREEWTYEVASALQHLVGGLLGASREGFEEAFRRLAGELPPPIGRLESMWLTETLSNVCWRAAISFHAGHHTGKSQALCGMQPLHQLAGTWALAKKSPRFKLRAWLSRFLRAFDLHHPPTLALKAAKLLQRSPATTLTTNELARRLG